MSRNYQPGAVEMRRVNPVSTSELSDRNVKVRDVLDDVIVLGVVVPHNLARIAWPGAPSLTVKESYVQFM